MAIEMTAPFSPSPSPESDDTVIVPDERVHPAFDESDADLILCSRDNVLFRVHSLVLRLASGWFRTLLTLPQSPPAYKYDAHAHCPEIIHMVESADVVAALLAMASGQTLPRLDAFELVEELVHAAEKYEMPGALSILRLALCTPVFLDAHPIRVYGIACQWGWLAEAQAASRKTIGIDLFSHDAVKDLGTIDSAHLTRLVLLHRRRREELKAGLDSPAEFYANHLPGRCTNCQREVAHVAWINLKYSWIAAIEQFPAEIASGKVLQRPEMHELLSAACHHCQRALYNAEGTITKLRSLLDRLPTTVEVSTASAYASY